MHRSETVHEKPIFMDSFFNHRCLIPADGWFEWEVIEGQKYPHYIFSEKMKLLRLPEFARPLAKRVLSEKCFPS